MEDIRPILQNWPYEPKNSIRKIIDANGAEKIQVRIDQGAFQGILQMDLDGRPDGKRPHNREFALDFYKMILQNYLNSNFVDEEKYRLDRKTCEELFEESTRLYERYVFLLQIQDYDRVIRDTERNMQLFRFVNWHAEHEEDKMNLEKWWPYVLRIHAVARVMVASQNQDYDSALHIIQETQEKIDSLGEVNAEEFQVERRRSKQALKELAKELDSKRPLSPIEKLKKKLTDAIQNEEFEKAARLRDRIQDLEKPRI